MTTDLVTELRHGKLRPGLRTEAADEIARLRRIVYSYHSKKSECCCSTCEVVRRSLKS